MSAPQDRLDAIVKILKQLPRRLNVASEYDVCALEEKRRHAGICGVSCAAIWLARELLALSDELQAALDALRAIPARDGCIGCGEANDGGYEFEDGPGPFCSSCWGALEDGFRAMQVAAPVSRSPEEPT